MQMTIIPKMCEILGFHHSVLEIFNLLWSCEALVGNLLSTFSDGVSVPPSTVKRSKNARAGEWVNKLRQCSQWLADRNRLWRTNGVLRALFTPTIIWFCQKITNYCLYISTHSPALAFFLECLALKDGTKLQTSMAQHPRRAKISNTETAWIN